MEIMNKYIEQDKRKVKIEDLFQDDNNENIPLHLYNREELQL